MSKSTLFRPRGAAACVVAFLSLAGAEEIGTAQTTTATHAGRPFVRIARANVTEPGIGFVQGLARAQVVGDEVAVAVLGAGFAGQGWVLGRGGPLNVAATVGTTVAGGAALTRFHDAMAVRGVAGAAQTFVFPAGATEPDALVRWSASGLSTVLASGGTLPGSGGKAMNRIGEVYEAAGQIAFIAWHDTGSGVDFRGVYRLVGGTPQTVANTVTALPGAVGVPDSFSSQVGFDGTTLAFWGASGAFAANQGMFRQSAPGGAVVAIVSSGVSLPDGGGTVKSVTSPPTVESGAVWFCVQDESRRNLILRERDGVLKIMARDGDVPAGGAALENLGQLGMEAAGGGLYFAASSSAGAGVYFVDDSGLRAVIPAGAVVAGARPTSIVLQDVDVLSDTLVLSTTGPGVQPAAVVANVVRPALPVIVTPPIEQTVARESRLELRVEALGDAPLTYLWQTPRGPVSGSDLSVLTIPSAGVRDVGYYSVRVTNRWGTASSGSVLVNVTAPPETSATATNLTAEAGDVLSIRVEAYGGLPLSYHWFRDGEPVTSGSPSPGFFVKNVAELGDAGMYSVIVSNAWGTVRAEVARVQMNPAAPNPSFGGGQFQTLIEGGAVLPGTSTVLGTDAPISSPTRWLGGDLVFSGVGPSFESLGLFRWSAGGVSVELALGTPLPGGAGVLDGARVIAAAGTDPLAFVGSVAGVPVGIYARFGAEWQTVIDTTTKIPSTVTNLFQPFYTTVKQVGDRFAFVGRDAGTLQGAYVASAGSVRRLLDNTMELPGLGTAGVHVQGVAFDGENAAVVVANRTLSESVLLRVGADDALSLLMKSGDSLPGTNLTARTFGPVSMAGGAVALIAFDTAFVRHALEWRDGVMRRVASPGMEIPGVGTVTVIESSEVYQEQGRVYLHGRVRLNGGSVVQAVFSAAEDGLQPVMNVPKLDGRRVSIATLQGVDQSRVLLGVRFDAGVSTWVANVGTPPVTAPRLEYLRQGASGLRVTVPIGSVLEASGALPGPWQELSGSGDVVLPFEGSHRFLRLKKP